NISPLLILIKNNHTPFLDQERSVVNRLFNIYCPYPRAVPIIPQTTGSFRAAGARTLVELPVLLRAAALLSAILFWWLAALPECLPANGCLLLLFSLVHFALLLFS